jgi:phosphoadenosine phosphosulfate reductase
LVTGRKRFHGGDRARLEVMELEHGTGRIKVNPLARWSAEDVASYLRVRDLPTHPLVAQGFRSIGCGPCTRPILDDDAPRCGRWWGSDKTECGIHCGAV